WAVVDNTQDEDWENVELALVAGLPVSFIHDLYTPRHIRRPVVEVQETTGVLPPTVEEAFELGVADYEEPESKGRWGAAAGGFGGRGCRCPRARGPQGPGRATTPLGRQLGPGPGARTQAGRPLRVPDRASRHHPPQSIRPGPHRAEIVRGPAGPATQPRYPP